LRPLERWRLNANVRSGRDGHRMTHPRNVHDRVRLGIVGLGAMGREFLEAARDHPDVNVVACADVDIARLDAAKSYDPTLAVHDDAMRVIRASNVDAVIVATPPDSHADLAIAAFEAGKAVLSEKPLAAQLGDGARMVEAAQASGIVNLVHYPFCDRKPVLEIERALRAGELGRPSAVEVRLLFPVWPRSFQAHAAWIDSRAEGGFLREVFSHFVYLTDRVLGPLIVHSVDLRAAAHDHAEHFVAARFSAAGLPVTLIGLTQAAVPETYEWTIYGTRESMRLKAWRELERFANGDWTPIAFEGELGSERTRLSELAKAVRGEPTQLPDFSVGYRIQRVIEACHGIQ